MAQMPSVQIALAPLIEACKRRQLLSRNAVASPIASIGASFSIGSERWRGLAILTVDALFLLRQEKQEAADPTAAVDPTAISRTPMLSVFYSDLPAILTGDANWPTPPSATCAVSVLPRDRTRSVRLVPFTTDIEFESEHPLVRVSCDAVGTEAASESIERTGWIVKAPAALPDRPKPGRKWTPMVMLGGLAALVALTVMLIHTDVVNATFAMLICIPTLAVAAWGMVQSQGGGAGVK